MSAEHLKLTSYFGERDRTSAGLLGDELLARCAGRGLQASVLLRGAEGFGAHHRLRSDRQLTLSEDLPVVVVAVDRRAPIEELLEEVLVLQRRGLLTLERASLTGAGFEQPDRLYEQTKLTVYLGRRQRIAGMSAFAAVCELLHRRGLAGASVLLGVDGTRRGERARARFFGRNSEVPAMVIAVGDGERVTAVLPELAALVPEPLFTLERVRICKRDGELLARPQELPAADAQGRPLWQKLTIYASQDAVHEGRPLSRQLLLRLRAAGAAGATSLRGVWGFHGAHRPHGDRLLQARRHVPVLTVAIDAPERIAGSFAIVDELTAEHGLVTSETVPALRAADAVSAHGGISLAEHRP